MATCLSECTAGWLRSITTPAVTHSDRTIALFLYRADDDDGLSHRQVV